MFVHLLPVYHVEEGFNVIGPPVLILQIISVLPDVYAQDRFFPLAERIVLIRSGNNFQLSIADHQPSPAASKDSCPCIGEELLEFVEAAEFRVQGLGNLT